MSNSEKYKQILKQLHLCENRVISSMLYNSGLKYDTIFGVTIIDLREIANQYAPDHELAMELWSKDIREMKVLSLLIDDPKAISQEQMDEQVFAFNNPELIEQACYKVFPQIPFALEKALTYCQHEDDYVKATGFTLIAKIAQLKLFENEEDFLPFFDLILEKSHNAGIYLRRSIATALRLIARVNDKMKEKSIIVVWKISKMKTEASEWIAQDISFELTNHEFINNLKK